MEDEVVEHADGIPLFIEELTRSVLESSRRQGIGPRSRHALDIPPTLEGSLRERLDRLSSGKQVAKVGSTIGREFSVELLALVSDLDRPDLERGLHELVDAGLLLERGSGPTARFSFKHALVQEAAYGGLLRGRRRQLHAAIAAALEEHFPSIAQTEPELLAHHLTGADSHERAVAYWKRAGEQALRRSANLEAIAHLEKGIELLARREGNDDDAALELEMQISLGQAYTQTRGFTSVEMHDAYARAWDLCRQLGETSAALPTLVGLRRYHSMHGEQDRVREIGQELIGLANRDENELAEIMGVDALARCALDTGALQDAREHFERVRDLCSRYVDAGLANRFGQDPGVDALTFGAWALWLLGHIDEARDWCHAAVARARALSHPFSLVAALSRSCVVHLDRGETEFGRALLEEATSVASDQGFLQWRSWQDIVLGWIETESGDVPTGIDRMRRSMAGFDATRASTYARFYAVLAAAYERNNDAEGGLQVITDWRGSVNASEIPQYEPELERLKGCLLLRTGSAADRDSAESDLQHAVALARERGVKSFELRAATSLARLWQRQDEHAKARAVLTPIHVWFSEGFDTADLRAATTLLESLS